MKNKQYDLILIHAPSIFDFRKRDDILFAFLSTGGTIAVSQIYEMYPLGLKALHTSLREKGKKVKIINLASMMLKDPDMDVEAFLGSLNAKMFGIDLYWLVHTHGSLAVANLLKKNHPDIPVIFGGTSASLFFKELIKYPQVDFVIRGAETSLFIKILLDKLSSNSYGDIPNLCWKDSSGKVIVNRFQTAEKYFEHVNWEYSDSDINYFVTIPGAGCRYNCTLCGGSNYSMQKHFGIKDGFAGKDLSTFLDELQSIKNHKGKSKRLVTLHHWFEDRDILKKALDMLEGGDIKTIHYTLFNLLPEDHLKLISRYEMRPLFEVTIESHDRVIRRKCGKSSFSNEELEKWLDFLYSHNAKSSVEIYFMIGLPMQTPESVMGDVEYASHLLTKYSNFDINAFICPMVPFLVPGSLVYENADKFGYKIFFTKLKDYERALLVPHWKDTLNYETEWMSRKQLVEVSYEACKKLVLAKKNAGKLPGVLVKSIVDKIDTTTDLLHLIDKYEGKPLPEDIRSRIREYNEEILKSTPTQQSPFKFSVYKQWYE